MRIWLGAILYNLLCIVEAIFNLILHLVFLHKIVGVLDISMPFYLWFTKYKPVGFNSSQIRDDFKNNFEKYYEQDEN